MGKSFLVGGYALRFGAAFSGGVFWWRVFGNDDAKESMALDEWEAEQPRQFYQIAA